MPAVIKRTLTVCVVALMVGAGLLWPSDKAPTYAATATLGSTNVGGSTDSGDSNYLNGSRFTMGSASGTVSSMSVYVAAVDPAPTNQFQLAIYSDSSGNPGTLLASSASGTLVANSWNTVLVSATLNASTSYWLMYNTNGTTASSNNMKYSAGGAAAWSSGGIAFGTWPSAFGPASTDVATFSIYATYDTGTGSGPTSTPTVPPTATSTPVTDASQVGQWSGPYSTPVVLNTGIQLKDGKVLTFGKIKDQVLFDPSNGTFTNAPFNNPNLDLLCSSEAFLPDGKVLIAGGGGVTPVGPPDVETFDPAANSWTSVAPLNTGRWYPTLTTLPDGRILATSGSVTNISDIAKVPEVYNPKTNVWTNLPNASRSLDLYPFMYVLPDGRVAHVGGSLYPSQTEVLDVNNQTWTVADSRVLDGGASVMYAPGKIMKSGSATESSATGPAKNTTYVIDFNQSNPQWQQSAPMNQLHAYHNLTMLPDGTALATGGETTQEGTIAANGVLPAELWNPSTKVWSVMAAMQTPRLYHSIAVLLPDGRVFVAGTGDDPGDGVPDFLSYETYSPPYLFKGARPSITSSPSGAIQYASSFFVGTPDAGTITKVALVAPSAVTHSTNMNQKYIPLTFTQTSGGLNIQAPANGNIAPPGPYMLFIVNSNGVPSVASWVNFPSPLYDSQPPTAPTNLTAQGGLGQASLSWTGSTDNVGVNHYNIYRSTTSGFSPSSATKVGQSTATSYTDTGMSAGTYYYLVTAVDAAGNESTPSNEASASVTADTTPPTVAMTAPSSGATVSGSVTVSATASDNVAVAGVQFQLDGVNLGSQVKTAPYTYAWDTTKSTNGTHTLTAIATDTSGNQTTSSSVTVTISNTMLVGDKTVESSTDNNSAGTAEAFQYTAAATGTAANLKVYLDVNNVATQVVVGIYTNNSTTNSPATLLAQGTITAPVAGAWNSVAITGVSITAGTKYWIAVLGPASHGTAWFRDGTSGSVATKTSSQTNLTSLPATWTTGANWSPAIMSAYAGR